MWDAQERSETVGPRPHTLGTDIYVVHVPCRRIGHRALACPGRAWGFIFLADLLAFQMSGFSSQRIYPGWLFLPFGARDIISVV